MEVQSEELSPIENISLKGELNKDDSEFIGDMDQMKPTQENNKKLESIEFINGPAKLKKKWVDFIGGQNVVDSMELSKNDIKRQEIIYEMIDTERDYVNDLSIIIELYIQPLKNSNILTKKDLNTLFSNIEQIYGVNKELLSLFEERQQKNAYVDEIGDIWLTMNEYLKIYLLYCSNYAYALTKLENLKSSKSFSKFLNTQFQRPESRFLQLDSFLIKPVQRICKYPLLLKELIKYTSKSNKDYNNLKNGYEKLQTVVNVVNGASKVVEAIYYLIDFQSRFNPKISIVSPSRKIKYKCEITIYTKKTISPTQQLFSQDLLNSNHGIEKKKRLLYIFNDMIIIAKSLSQEPDKLERGKLKLIEKRDFSDVKIDSNSETEDKDQDMENTIEISFSNPDALNIIFCESIDEKTELLNQLTSSLKEYQTTSSRTNPKVVKRLPSEKVYTMISNMSQDIPDLENEINSQQKEKEEDKEEKIEEEEEKIEALSTLSEDKDFSLKEKILIGIICTGMIIIALSVVILSLIICDYIQPYINYIYIGLSIAFIVMKYKKEKGKLKSI